jgi:ATP-dependent protease ClpP protease subunit
LRYSPGVHGRTGEARTATNRVHPADAAARPATGRASGRPRNGPLPERGGIFNRARGDKTDRSWFRIVNADQPPAQQGPPAVAEIWIYDEIGMWGITAGDFVAQLSQVEADAIDLHVNSPGGDVYDGIAILNALRSHPADVTTYVDGIAASIASVIAMGGNQIIMARNSQMMIHDAFGLCVGDAATMRETADMLDKASDNIADVYNARAGGGIALWRSRMKNTTWYSADEAVAAKLADEVAAVPSRSKTKPAGMANEWDLSVFHYAGRGEAPAPNSPALAATASAADVVTASGTTVTITGSGATLIFGTATPPAGAGPGEEDGSVVPDPATEDPAPADSTDDDPDGDEDDADGEQEPAALALSVAGSAFAGGWGDAIEHLLGDGWQDATQHLTTDGDT